MHDDDINAQIDYLKHELTVLKTHVELKVPWYREASTVVAILALVFSLGTTAVSYFKAKEQEYISTRIELRSIMERLSDLPREHAEMQKIHKDNPALISQLSAQVNSENLALSNQADAILTRIEATSAGKGKILDIEFLSVATALTSSFQHHKAKVLLEKAFGRARDATTAAGILRSLAGNSIYFNDSTAAREYMKRARQVYDNDIYRNDAKINQYVTNATTEIQWANMELILSDCKETERHLVEASRLTQLLPFSSFTQQFTAQITEIRKNLSNCLPAAQP